MTMVVGVHSKMIARMIKMINSPDPRVEETASWMSTCWPSLMAASCVKMSGAPVAKANSVTPAMSLGSRIALAINCRECV